MGIVFSISSIQSVSCITLYALYIYTSERLRLILLYSLCISASKNASFGAYYMFITCSFIYIFCYFIHIEDHRNA